MQPTLTNFDNVLLEAELKTKLQNLIDLYKFKIGVAEKILNDPTRFQISWNEQGEISGFSRDGCNWTHYLW